MFEKNFFPQIKSFLSIGLLLAFFVSPITSLAQKPAAELLQQVRAKIDIVNDYEASGTMKTNVVFIKSTQAKVKVYFKKPDKLRIRNENGLSFIPKGSMNINLNSIFIQTADFDAIDAGNEPGSGFRIIKILPKEENNELVLSTLYIDEKLTLVRKAKITTRANGTYELEMSYGEYASYGLADKLVFTFNIQEYKLPKGVTFDYDDGSDKKKPATENKDKKGRVEITYSSYIINKGVPDAIFQQQ
jgi:outer membrane lipoprotein-sorting protein